MSKGSIKYIISLFLFLIFSETKAQDVLNFVSVDKMTYEFYTEKKWDDLISLGEKAIENNIDYYYLRMRLGIAYFESKKFVKSTTHFKKALEFNSGDAVAGEYLYYAFLNAGLTFKSEQVLDSLPSSVQNKITKGKKIFIKDIYFESGYSLNGDYQKSKMVPETQNNEILQRNLTQDSWFANLSLTHKVGRHSSFTHSYSGLILNWIGQYNIYNIETREFPHNTKQNQYYLAFNFHNKNKTRYTLATHLLWIKNNYNSFNYGTLAYPIVPVFQNVEESSFDKVILAGFDNEYNYSRWGMSVSVSDLNYQLHWQINTRLIIYPTGNLNFYTKTDFSLRNPDAVPESVVQKRFGRRTSSAPSLKPVLSQHVGFKAGFIWMDVFYTYGMISNFVENDGYTIYNDVDRLTLRTGISLEVPLKKMVAFIRYQYQQKDGDIYNYYLSGATSRTMYKYNNHQFLCGLKIKF